jgi:hypothetical protein
LLSIKSFLKGSMTISAFWRPEMSIKTSRTENFSVRSRAVWPCGVYVVISQIYHAAKLTDYILMKRLDRACNLLRGSSTCTIVYPLSFYAAFLATGNFQHAQCCFTDSWVHRVAWWSVWLPFEEMPSSTVVLICNFGTCFGNLEVIFVWFPLHVRQRDLQFPGWNVPTFGRKISECVLGDNLNRKLHFSFEYFSDLHWFNIPAGSRSWSCTSDNVHKLYHPIHVRQLFNHFFKCTILQARSVSGPTGWKLAEPEKSTLQVVAMSHRITHSEEVAGGIGRKNDDKEDDKSRYKRSSNLIRRVRSMIITQCGIRRDWTTQSSSCIVGEVTQQNEAINRRILAASWKTVVHPVPARSYDYRAVLTIT